MPYGGNCLTVDCFSFFGGNDVVGGGKTEIWRQCHTAVMPYGGSFRR